MKGQGAPIGFGGAQRAVGGSEYSRSPGRTRRLQGLRVRRATPWPYKSSSPRKARIYAGHAASSCFTGPALWARAGASDVPSEAIAGDEARPYPRARGQEIVRCIRVTGPRPHVQSPVSSSRRSPAEEFKGRRLDSAPSFVADVSRRTDVGSDDRAFGRQSRGRRR